MTKVITEHYLAGLNPDVTFGINTPILYLSIVGSEIEEALIYMQ
jgi:hypothetical protein